MGRAMCTTRAAKPFEVKDVIENAGYFGTWRTGRDSNPRYGFPYTHFPGVRLQPLGHLSGALLMTAVPSSFKARDEGFCTIPLKPVRAVAPSAADEHILKLGAGAGYANGKR